MHRTRLERAAFLSLGPCFLAACLLLAGCTTDQTTLTGVDLPSVETGSAQSELAPTRELRATYGTLGATSAASKGATVARGFSCSVGPAGITFDSVSSLSKKGEKLYCRGSLTVGTEPDATLIITGDLCFLPLSRESTTNSRLVISTSGRVELTCRS